jgi:hypothetical protein
VSVLSLPEVSQVFAKSFVSVHVDQGELAENDPREAIVKRHNSSHIHPVMVFLDSQGKEVARIKGGLKGKDDALLLNRFISGKYYLKSDYGDFKAAQVN